MATDTRARLRRAWLAGLGLLLACGPEAPPPLAPTEPTAAAEPSADPAATATNRPPELRSVRFEPDPPLSSERVSVRAEALDPDGDPVRLIYRWSIAGQETRRSEASFDVPRKSKGSLVEVRIVAHDGKLESEPITLSEEVGNHPPTLVDLAVSPAGGLTVESEIVATARAEDADGDPVEFSYRWRVNDRYVGAEGPILDRSHFARGDAVAVEVVANDGDDESEPLRSPSLEVQNSVPVVTSKPAGLDATGTFRYTPQVEDADGDRRMRFRLIRAPEGMTIDWLKGHVSWRPREEQAGKHPVEIEVDDQAGGVVAQSFDLDVQFTPPESEAPESSDAPAAQAP